MSFPGYTAETSLYDIRTLRPSYAFKDVVSQVSPYLFCGGLGQACCHQPHGSLVSCDKGLGCDIITNRCGANCGHIGEVCCDGPETDAAKWTADGKVFSPNSFNMRKMCETGVCDTATHRCINCGTQLNGACCPPDISFALGRCFHDAKTGSRLVCNDPWAGASGHCVECGGYNEPICLNRGETRCDDGLVAGPNGNCVFCGQVGQPVCDQGDPCRGGHAVPDKSYSTCIQAGGANQPCRPDGGCDYQALFCNPKHVCQPCGHPGEICCPPGALDKNAPCLGAGECRDGKCFECGQENMPVCNTGDPCKCLCKPINGFCRPCGSDGQPCCEAPWWACYEGAHCDDGTCHKPGANPGGGQAHDCNGQPYTLYTLPRGVLIEDPSGCVRQENFIAGSDAEASQCAHTKYGNAVVEGPLEDYTWSVTCNLSCTMITFYGRDFDGAVRCAYNTFPGCTILDIACPPQN